MRSMPSLKRRLLVLVAVFLPLLSTACATRSTPASLARTERPTLPTLPPALTRTERLAPLAAASSGEPVTIDRAQLGELAERLAEAVAAVERGNLRVEAFARLWACTDAAFRTGATPAACTAD